MPRLTAYATRMGFASPPLVRLAVFAITPHTITRFFPGASPMQQWARSSAMAKVAGEKLLSQAIKERRATPSFEDVPIHGADLEKIIRAGLEAPSGYNLQPWRFVVVRDHEQKKKLRQTAFGQAK